MLFINIAPDFQMYSMNFKDFAKMFEDFIQISHEISKCFMMFINFVLIF